MKRKLVSSSAAAVFIVTLLILSQSIYANNIDPDNNGYQWSWGENVGWLNFEPVGQPGVTVQDYAVIGSVWGENVGWIYLNPFNFGGVTNDGRGNLGGYAWGENVGWISFSCDNTSTCGDVLYQVTIDVNGKFHGNAWGENIGYINFDLAASGTGVKTSWGDADDDDVWDVDDLCAATAANGPVDGAGCSDSQVDRDGDGVCNPGAPSGGPSACTGSDVFPDDPTESSDNDGDGIGDNADADDDNDDQSDGDEVACGSDPLDAASKSPDADGDNVPDCVDPDDDNDLVDDVDDICPSTAIPDGAPLAGNELGKNRWSLLAGTDGDFTQALPQAGSKFSFSTNDTRGCSCEQIIEAMDLGKKHLVQGCTTSVMLDWIENP